MSNKKRPMMQRSLRYRSVYLVLTHVNPGNGRREWEVEATRTTARGSTTLVKQFPTLAQALRYIWEVIRRARTAKP